MYPNYTLAQHSAAVGRDMQPYIDGYLKFYKDRVIYIGSNINEDFLDLIRMDKGVKLVKEETLSMWDPKEL